MSYTRVCNDAIDGSAQGRKFSLPKLTRAAVSSPCGLTASGTEDIGAVVVVAGAEVAEVWVAAADVEVAGNWVVDADEQAARSETSNSVSAIVKIRLLFFNILLTLL